MPARSFVVVDVLGVDDDLDGRGVVEFAQLERRELGLRRTTATEDVHLDGLVVLQTLVDVRRNLRRQQLVAGLGEHAGDVERDVADTEDGDLLRLERPGARHVGVTVVPGHEVGGAVAASRSMPGMFSARSAFAPVEKITAS